MKLPLGKLPPDLLARLLSHAPISDPRVLQGPGIGVDCAVVDAGKNLLVFKADPITFATDEIGWYAVQINANDIATTGATPRWMLATLLLPENNTTEELVSRIGDQLFSACDALGISLVGGHTEVTYGLDRPILIGTLIGEVERSKRIAPQGAHPGNKILLTKGIPIEATAILAREFPERLSTCLSPEEIQCAAGYLHNPGISVVRDAQIAVGAGRVTAMHDPTEGGLASALWELSQASGFTFAVEPAAVPVPPLSKKVCDVFGLDPLATIASGALLLTAEAADVPSIQNALNKEGIICAEIGEVVEGPVLVKYQDGNEWKALPRPLRDDITRVYEHKDESAVK